MKQKPILPRITQEEAAKIKAVMTRKKISQKKLGEKINYNQGMIHNLLASLKAMNPERARTFYEALDKDPEIAFLEEYIEGKRQPYKREEGLDDKYNNHSSHLREIFRKSGSEVQRLIVSDLENAIERYQQK